MNDGSLEVKIILSEMCLFSFLKHIVMLFLLICAVVWMNDKIMRVVVLSQNNKKIFFFPLHC